MSTPTSALTLDAITSTICVASGADFAFILTRKGRLLTRDAPPQMPEVGRVACVSAAEETQAAGTRLTELTLPREQLVPYGGAAPVDVFVAPCGEAILCVVLATWADASHVGPSLDEALPQLEALLAKAKANRGGRRGKTVAPPPPPPTPDTALAARRSDDKAGAKPGRGERAAPTTRSRSRRASELPPPGARTRPPTSRPAPRSPGGRPPSIRPRALSGLVELSKSGIRANEQLQSSPTIRLREGANKVRGPLSSEVPLGGRGSLPMIEIGEQPLGRESLAAIEADGRARGSLPDIEISEAPLGRESLAAIEADGQARGFIPRVAVAEVPQPGPGPRTAPRTSAPASIEVGSAMLGRESLAAIEADRRDQVPSGSPHTSAPDLEVHAEDASEIGSLPPPDPVDRTTQPWTESPDDALRATRAQGGGRLPPSSAALRPPPPVNPEALLRKRKQNSNVDLFRQALGDLLEPGVAPPEDD